MKASIPYIEKKFEEFNQQMFAGRLPKLPIELSEAKTFLGLCVYKRRKLDDGKEEKYDFRLRFNTRIDLPEEVIEDTIIHEMIHYFIGVNQMQDSSSHGPLFLYMMNTINEKFGRHLTVSHKGTEDENNQSYDTTPRYHVVAVVGLTNGKKGIKVIPRVIPRILDYYNKMIIKDEVRDIRLYMTNNPFFNRFPNSASLKIHILEEEVICENLGKSKELICDGKSIKEK